MMRHRRSTIPLALLLMLGSVLASQSFAADTRDAPQKMQVAGLDVAAWIPDRSTPGPWPIIIFSHGFHGCSTQSKFLMEALAAHGYAVFAPNHRDWACREMSRWTQKSEAPLGDPAAWNDASYLDRAQDVEKLLDALSADPKYHAPPFDWNHVGLVGHSLGGYTALELAGAWPSRKDPRVKAVLALSPYAQPFILKNTLGGLGSPVMYQGGTRDIGITPAIKKNSGGYDQSPAPKYYIEFDGAGHFAWTDIRATYHAAIVDYSLAFLDKYLKGKPFPPALEKIHPGVSQIEIAP